MSRSKDYQRLLNSRRWWEVKRMVWQRANGLCEDCLKQNIVRAGVDCHHVIPVETAHSPQEMETLCFNADNIRLLCVPCHIRIHQEMRSHTKEQHLQREEDRQKTWMSRHKRPPE